MWCASARTALAREALLSGSSIRCADLLVQCVSAVHRPLAVKVTFGISCRHNGSAAKKVLDRIDAVPLSRIRNFGIIAHVDHGKSTLCDRLLQVCDVIPKDSPDQFLDGLEVERSRGITVKAQTCSMLFRYERQRGVPVESD